MSDDADRRMRLLEMAGGDLDRAMKMECWVCHGSTDPDALAAPATKKSDMIGNVRIVIPEGHNPFPPPEFDDLAIPAFLDRRIA